MTSLTGGSKATISKSRSISIKELAAESEKNKGVKKGAEEEFKKFDDFVMNFSQEELVSAIKKFAITLEESYPNLSGSMLRRDAKIDDKGVIELIIDNKLLESDIRSTKAEFMAFLRGELKNEEIQLISTVIENKTEVKAYVPKLLMHNEICI